MQPTLQPGDTLLGWRWLWPGLLWPGRIIVACVFGRPIIKRLIAVAPTGLILHGDNAAASTDSRQFGPIGYNTLEAVVLMKLP
jgi:hypothetical protein